MDGVAQVRVHGALLVDGLAHDVEQAAERGVSHRHHDGLPVGDAAHAAAQAVGAAHGDRAHRVVADLLFDLKGLDEPVVHGDRDGVVDFGQIAVGEDEVDDRTDDGRDGADDRLLCWTFASDTEDLLGNGFLRCKP